jgi:sulfonate transport system substrate-binding protein
MQSLKSVFPLGCLLVLLTTCSEVRSTNPVTADITNTDLRVAKYKGGWDLDLKLAGLDNFPYKVQFTEFTGGNLMVQSINAGAIDLASASEIPPIFAIESQASIYPKQKQLTDNPHSVLCIHTLITNYALRSGA